MLHAHSNPYAAALKFEAQGKCTLHHFPSYNSFWLRLREPLFSKTNSNHFCKSDQQELRITKFSRINFDLSNNANLVELSCSQGDRLIWLHLNIRILIPGTLCDVFYCNVKQARSLLCWRFKGYIEAKCKWFVASWYHDFHPAGGSWQEVKCHAICGWMFAQCVDGYRMLSCVAKCRHQRCTCHLMMSMIL